MDITNTYLETQRLILRPFQETDAQDLYEYASIEGVGEAAGWKHHGSIEESQRILRKFIDGKNVFAVTLKQTGKVIGSLGIHASWTDSYDAYKHLNAKEIGYVLSKDYWGRGLMPEAVACAINFCFEKGGLDAVTCCHFVSNGQSRRVIEKSGFILKETGTFYAKQLGTTVDDLKYILYKNQ